MTSTCQSVNYQDTNLEGNSTRNILDIRAFLLLLFLCIYFKFCSYFMFNLFYQEGGDWVFLWFSLLQHFTNKIQKVLLLLLHCLLCGSVFFSCFPIFLFQKTSRFFFPNCIGFKRPHCHPQSTLKNSSLIFLFPN